MAESKSREENRSRPKSRGGASSDNEESGPTFKRGEHVYALKNPTAGFKPGKILTVHRNGLYDVVFDDNSDAVDLPPNRIRKMTEDKSNGETSADDENSKQKKSPRKGDENKTSKSFSSPRSTSPTRQSQNNENSDNDNEEENPPKKKQNSGTASKNKVLLFAVGDQVEARREGHQKYRFAVIAEVYDDNTYDVVYSDRFRERLEVDMIQFPFGNDNNQEDGNTQKEEQPQQPQQPKRPNTSNGKENKKSQVSSCPFKVGMKVEARYQAGRVFYPGQITELNIEEETATIVYEDGDEESLVPFAFIMVPPTSSSSSQEVPSRSTTAATPNTNGRPATGGGGNNKKSMLNKKIKFTIGSKVEGNYRGTGKWYPGVIADIREEDGDYIYSIDYNDGDKDENMSEDRLREPKSRRPTGKPSAATIAAAATAEEDHEEQEEEEKPKSSPLKNRNKTTAVASNEITASPPSKAQSIAATLDVTSIRIEGNYANQGTWYPGHILRERPNGRVDIQYDDGDREDNVPLDRIRRLLPSSTTTTTAKSSPVNKKRGKDDSNNDNADDPEESYMEGDRIEGNFRNAGEYYPGCITKVKTDLTTGLRYVDILYDDGDNEKGVPLSRVRKLPTTAKKSSGNSKGQGQGKKHSHPSHRRHQQDETTDGDDEDAIIERETRERLTSKGKNKHGNSKNRQETDSEGGVVDPMNGGALIEMRDADKKWYLGRIMIVNQKKGHASIRLLHSGEIRHKVQFNLIRLPRSTVTLKETDGKQQAIAKGGANGGGSSGNGFVELNASDIQALRALLQEKDEEISRLRKMVKQLELNQPLSSGGNKGGIDSDEFNQEIAALKKSNEDLKNSVVFLGEKFSLVVDELVKVKTKNNQLSKQVKVQGEEMNRWKSMGYGINIAASTPKSGRNLK